MGIKLGEAAREIFGETQTIEFSDERWEEVKRKWAVIREENTLSDIEVHASAKDLEKQCTY